MNNKGSATVEMCFVMPLLLGVIMVLVNMLVNVMNESLILESIYRNIYLKESLALESGEDIETILKERIEEELNNELRMVDDIDVDVYVSQVKHYGLLDSTEGYIKVVAAGVYEGQAIANIIDNPQQKIDGVGQYELRDTSDKLRRWQIYGDVLSK